MNEYRTRQHRPEHEIVVDLEHLSQESGFVYTFCNIVRNSVWMSPDEAADIDWHHRPNYQELSFLLGLMVKRPLKLTDPPSRETAHEQIRTAIALLEELHLAHGFSPARSAIETPENFEEWVAEYVQSYDDWMSSGSGMVEPIFYGGGGGYYFQYLEMAERRYRDDKAWLEQHLGASFEEILEIAWQLNQLSLARVNSIRDDSTFEEACLHYLEAFLFEPGDIQGITDGSIDSFIRTFSLTPGRANRDLDTIGAYNEVHSHPVLRLEDERFFLPLFFYLADSIYESPYYWMSRDSSYKETGFKNRGNATEKIAHELLTQVFGEDNVFCGVKVKKGKNDVTDIDVLALEGNKAVIVQAKSKKLTEASRKGEGKKLESDFQAAVQDAYDQALVSRNALLEAGNSLTIDGRSIDRLKEAIDEAYIICLTGDYYPSVIFQVESYLQKEESDPYPIAVNIFDLDIMTFYLRDPFDFLYYLRQRSKFAEHFKSDSEIGFLAFHLQGKLFLAEPADYAFIEPAYAQLIEAHFPVAKGHWPRMNAESGLFSKWRNKEFEKIVYEVKMLDHQGIPDVVFLLYDWAGPGADNFIKIYEKTKRGTLRDGKFHDAAVFSNKSNRGITFVSYPETSSYTEEQSYLEKFGALAIAQKQRSRADEWLAFASRSGSQRSFDSLWYSKEPWQPDPDLDDLVEPLLDPRRAVSADGRKIGRNEPCPCGSGQKYKNCHGK